MAGFTPVWGELIAARTLRPARSLLRQPQRGAWWDGLLRRACPHPLVVAPRLERDGTRPVDVQLVHSASARAVRLANLSSTAAYRETGAQADGEQNDGSRLRNGARRRAECDIVYKFTWLRRLA